MCYYMGLQKRTLAHTYGPATNSVDLNRPVREFLHQVKSWQSIKEGMDIFIRHLKQKKLPDEVFPNGMRPGPPAKAQAAATVSEQAEAGADEKIANKRPLADTSPVSNQQPTAVAAATPPNGSSAPEEPVPKKQKVDMDAPSPVSPEGAKEQQVPCPVLVYARKTFRMHLFSVIHLRIAKFRWVYALCGGNG
jgi:hypothetical protein